MRPCDHPDEPRPDVCSICKLYVTKEKYRRAFDAMVLPPVGQAPKPQPPSLLRRAVNFSKAMVRAAATGFKNVTPEVLASRRAVCDGCEMNDKVKDICLHPKCGCKLKRGLVTKLQLVSEKCPLGKW